MLLESFARQLEILRAVNRIDAATCGAEAAESFVVETRVRLVSAANPVVELPSVGTLVRDGDAVFFQPSETLKQDSNKHKLLLPKRYRAAFPFRKREQPEAGLALLKSIGTSFLASKLAEDTRLEKLSLDSLSEIFCLGIHDAICCGSGIELETVGTFAADLTFEIDEVLSASIKHSKPMSAGGDGRSGFTISLIRTET
jgi:hypothetical protein